MDMTIEQYRELCEKAAKYLRSMETYGTFADDDDVDLVAELEAAAKGTKLVPAALNSDSDCGNWCTTFDLDPLTISSIALIDLNCF